MLRFSGIDEYSFHYKSDLAFYYIESIKFYKDEPYFYVSLDPVVDGNEERHEKDNDFIKAENVCLWINE